VRNASKGAQALPVPCFTASPQAGLLELPPKRADFQAVNSEHKRKQGDSTLLSQVNDTAVGRPAARCAPAPNRWHAHRLRQIGPSTIARSPGAGGRNCCKRQEPWSCSRRSWPAAEAVQQHWAVP